MRLGIYLVATFAITWSSWWTLAHFIPPGGSPSASPGFMILYLLGGFGPTIGAIIAVASTRRAYGRGDYLARLLRWRVGAVWWLAAIAAPTLFAAGKEWIAVWAGGGGVTPADLDAPAKALVIFPTMIVGGGLEELGWRGVAQPEVERRISRLAATLVVGAAWALWHLPLFHIPGVSQSGGDFPLFALDVVSNAYLLAWLYARTQSILLCVVGHAASNSATAMGVMAITLHAATPLWIAVSVKLLAAVILVATTLPRSVDGPSGPHR
jgi:membrane protease YdiL (CAAX protease family)